MRLTSYSNFSLRTLMVAAMRDPQLSTVQEVAEAFGISRAHLVKCVHQLGQWGYLVNVRGNRGGFRLARPAAEITLGEVVRRTEEGFDLVECFDPATATCPLVGRCRLSTALKSARDVFLAELDRLTVADIITNRDEILDILRLDAPGRAAGFDCGVERPSASGDQHADDIDTPASKSMSAAMSARLQPFNSFLKAE
ncbi:Rrf2 family transcriptional regulator [Pinisolibacter aquiterrae]|uniref:Rrf2 family transcriptional regulator n=1 Tax=Pinisolibacter aquiterrae TaxID=2815579 RepID=UPI001C3CD81A|nr:Rrf2 family transcriptional regulator [Pinisolibacter aquiterrae]MBV5265606.1 Rrf2 family transcriptional regulator [Pinisolibacter aquiterrae]MCC8236828.1 Rrf2 family transcriptional regulator [Pinisolibacter aquiterrae]